MKKSAFLSLVFLIIISCSSSGSESNESISKKTYYFKVTRAMASFGGGFNDTNITEKIAEFQTDSMAYNYAVMFYYSVYVVGKNLEHRGTPLYKTVGFSVFDEDGVDVKSKLTESCKNSIDIRVKENFMKELEQ